MAFFCYASWLQIVVVALANTPPSSHMGVASQSTCWEQLSKVQSAKAKCQAVTTILVVTHKHMERNLGEMDKRRIVYRPKSSRAKGLYPMDALKSTKLHENGDECH